MSSTSLNAVRRLGLAFVLIAAAAGSARATAPNLMTYQGRIKESGLPVTGVRTVDVQICDSLVAGTCNTTGAQGVSVANGLFRTTFTVPSGVSLETGSWFLEVHVNGAAFGPREMLSANAYAIYASSATTLIVNPGDPAVFISPNVAIAGSGFSVGASTFVVAGGNVGIGTATPGATLEVSGQLTLSGAGHVRASGAGAPPPAVGASSCGTGASIVGSDTVGRVTVGSSAAGCKFFFGAQWSPNLPVCHFSGNAGLVYATSAQDSFSVTITASPLSAGDVSSYICLSY
jgi:hypothetical protein